MFGKEEKKRSKRTGGVIVGALATVGAIGIFKKGKRMVRDVGRRVKKFLGIKGCEDDS